MSSWAKVGAKCVCVKELENPSAGELLVKGRIYTIKSVEAGAPNGNLGIHLKEARTPNIWGYWVERFRPITPPKQKTLEQDIALFNTIKTGVPA